MSQPSSSTVLGRITGPSELKDLSAAERVELAREIRERICQVVSKNGGHFGSNLGVVELTIALHTVFDAPYDKIVWDVSHQCYPHKLLTGRGATFDTLRTYEGISGFCHKGESEHDVAFAGHAGTATSIALGIAAGDVALGLKRQTVSVVGDASLVSGMTLEALNHAGHLGAPVLIILNDNGMSISFPVGGLHHALSAVRGTGVPAANPYKARDPEHVPADRDAAGFFERLGLNYVGPIDGHDTEALIATLSQLKHRPGPTLLHVHTRKGHGWEPSIEDPITWHAAKSFYPPSVVSAAPAAAAAPGAPKRPSWTQAFSRALIDLAHEDPRVVAITAAMLGGTGLDAFDKQFPTRCFDVGIAEQHGTGFASGLRLAGLRPVFAVYSTFLQRGYDQVVHDVAIQGNPMVLAMDRGGLVGDDGVTHQGLFDISYLRCIPDVVLAAPADEPDLRAMLRWAVRSDRIVGLRWPRDTVPEPFLRDSGSNPPIELGRGRVIRGGEGDLAFFAYGAMVQTSLEATHLLAHQGITGTVVDARFAKPIDVALLIDMLERHELVVTVEDHAQEGGFGSACAQAVLARRPDLVTRLRIAGVPDAFVHHGARPLQLRDAGLDPAGLVERAREGLRAGRPRRREPLALSSRASWRG